VAKIKGLPVAIIITSFKDGSPCLCQWEFMRFRMPLLATVETQIFSRGSGTQWASGVMECECFGWPC